MITTLVINSVFLLLAYASALVHEPKVTVKAKAKTLELNQDLCYEKSLALEDNFIVEQTINGPLMKVFLEVDLPFIVFTMCYFVVAGTLILTLLDFLGERCYIHKKLDGTWDFLAFPDFVNKNLDGTGQYSAACPEWFVRLIFKVLNKSYTPFLSTIVIEYTPLIRNFWYWSNLLYLSITIVYYIYSTFFI